MGKNHALRRKHYAIIGSIKVNGEETVLVSPFTTGDEPGSVELYGVSKAEIEQALLTRFGVRVKLTIHIERSELNSICTSIILKNITAVPLKNILLYTNGDIAGINQRLYNPGHESVTSC